MKTILLITSSLFFVSCATTASKKTNDIDAIDGVIVGNMVMGYNLTEAEAKSIIATFKVQHPDYKPTMLNNMAGSVSIMANGRGEKSKMFIGKKTSNGWQF